METRHLESRESRVETRRGPDRLPSRLAPPLPATEDWVAGKRGFSTHCREHRSTMLPEETAGTARSLTRDRLGVTALPHPASRS